MAEGNPPFSYMENLPPEIREKILSYLKYAEIARLRSVNCNLNRTCIHILNRGFEKVKSDLDKRCTDYFEAVTWSTTNVSLIDKAKVIYNRFCCVKILKLFLDLQKHYLRYAYLKRTISEEPEFVFIHGNTLDLFHSAFSADRNSLSKFSSAMTSLLEKCQSQIERIIGVCDRPLTSEEEEELKNRIDECKIDERHNEYLLKKESEEYKELYRIYLSSERQRVSLGNDYLTYEDVLLFDHFFLSPDQIGCDLTYLEIALDDESFLNAIENLCGSAR